MQYKEVCLESFGYVLPERIMTSLEIEDRIKPLYEKLSFKHGRLQALTGIKKGVFGRLVHVHRQWLLKLLKKLFLIRK